MVRENIKYTPAISKQNRKRFFFLGIGSLCILLMIASLILIVTGYLVTKHLVYQERYIVVIDAGSTSSKISVFVYNDYPWREQGYVTEKDMLKIKPGISSFVDDPKKAYARIESGLKDLITKNIPNESLAATPLYLAATAGVRLTKIQSPEKTDKLIETLRDDLSEFSGLRVENKTRDIKILSGMEEGIYAWITVNYMNKHFGTKPISLVKDPKDSAGILDLGGASTQITFAIPDSEYNSLPKDFIYANKNIEKMRLYGKDVNLYSKSLLCLGKNQLQKHVHGSFIYDTIFGNPDPEKKTQGIVQNFVLIGSGNYELCRNRIQDLLGRKGPGITGCNDEFCTIGGEYQPRPKRDYYAFAGFYYIFEFLEKAGDGREIVMNKNKFRNKVKDLCIKKDLILNQDTLEEVSPEVKNFCFDGVYVEYLLEKYGFDTDDSWNNIRFIKKIDNTTVSWALGYAIVTSGFIPFERPNLFIPYDLFVPLIISFGLLLLFLVVVLPCIKFRKKLYNDSRAQQVSSDNLEEGL